MQVQVNSEMLALSLTIKWNVSSPGQGLQWSLGLYLFAAYKFIIIYKPHLAIQQS